MGQDSTAGTGASGKGCSTAGFLTILSAYVSKVVFSPPPTSPSPLSLQDDLASSAHSTSAVALALCLAFIYFKVFSTSSQVVKMSLSVVSSPWLLHHDNKACRACHHSLSLVYIKRGSITVPQLFSPSGLRSPCPQRTLFPFTVVWTLRSSTRCWQLTGHLSTGLCLPTLHVAWLLPITLGIPTCCRRDRCMT